MTQMPGAFRRDNERDSDKRNLGAGTQSDSTMSQIGSGLSATAGFMLSNSPLGQIMGYGRGDSYDQMGDAGKGVYDSLSWVPGVGYAAGLVDQLNSMDERYRAEQFPSAPEQTYGVDYGPGSQPIEETPESFPKYRPTPADTSGDYPSESPGVDLRTDYQKETGSQYLSREAELRAESQTEARTQAQEKADEQVSAEETQRPESPSQRKRREDAEEYRRRIDARPGAEEYRERVDARPGAEEYRERVNARPIGRSVGADPGDADKYIGRSVSADPGDADKYIGRSVGRDVSNQQYSIQQQADAAISRGGRDKSLFSPMDVDSSGMIDASPDQISGLARRAEELGVEGSVFKEYADTQKAYEQLTSGASGLGDRQQTEAVLQTRARLKDLSRRVVNRRHEIGRAEQSQSRRDQAQNEGRIDGIIRRQQQILGEDSRREYGTAMTPSEALQQAMVEDMQSQAIRSVVGGAISGQQPNLSQTQIGSMVMPANPQQRRQRQMTGGLATQFSPEIIANASEYLRNEFGENLPYTLGMGGGGSGAMTLTTPEGFSFIGAVHEASEIPVAVVTNELEKQKAEVAGIPYVTDRNPQELQNPYKRPKAGSRPAVGIASYDEDLDRTAFAEEVTAEIDEVWTSLQQYDEMTSSFTGQSRTFNRLTKYMSENDIDLGGPSGEIDIMGIGQLQQRAQDDPELAAILESLGVTDETETLRRGTSPDEGMDDGTLNAIALRDRMVREQNRNLESAFRSKYGDELIVARDKVARGEASPEYAEQLRYIDRVTRGGKVDERNFKRRFMQEEIERRLIEKQETAQLQQDVLDDMTGARQTQAGRQSLQQNYQRSFEPNTGQSIMTTNERSPNPAFQFRALPAANVGGTEVPVASNWGDMAHVSFDTPFVITSGSKQSEIILDRQAFNSAMEPVMQNRMKWGRTNFEGGEEHSRAVVDVMKLMMQSVPNGFFGDREALKIAAIEMVKRLGYTNRNDQNTARYAR